MSLVTADLPCDPIALHAFATACQAELATATAELQAARRAIQLRTLEVEKLKFQIARLRRMQLGKSCERITRRIEQLELQLESWRPVKPKPHPGTRLKNVPAQPASAKSRSASHC